MDMVMANGFGLLNEQEMMLVDGGFDLGQFLGGLLDVGLGVVEVIAGGTSMAVPEPTAVTKVIGWSTIVGGAKTVLGGFGEIKDSFN